MIPLIGILLCIYLVFKGFEILQIAICSDSARWTAFIIGAVAVVSSIVIGAFFAFLFVGAGASVPNSPLVR